MNTVLSLTDIKLNQDNDTILSIPSANLEEGKITLVVGPSGCGKSIFLKVCAGIVLPDQGIASYKGENIAKFDMGEEREFRKKCGFIFQDAALWSTQTIYQNLELPLRYHFPEMDPDALKQKIVDFLKYLHFYDDVNNRPNQLSLGERKIISFARGVITDPDIVFMDNPFMAIDHHNRERMLDIIKKLRQKKATLIIASHDSEFISMYADNIIVMEQGEILEAGGFTSVRDSTDIRVTGILERVLNEITTYDTNILDLLDSE